MNNSEIAEVLDDVADLLERRGNNAYRVRSYRRAAETVCQADRSVTDILEEDGVEGLQELPNVGERLAGAVRELAETGRLGLHERLRADLSCEDVLGRVPGIGPTLARRIHDKLGIDSLEALEGAAHDGRLAEVRGVGDRKVAGVREALAGMLSRSARRRARRRATGNSTEAKKHPSVALLLDVDATYRRQAAAGKLRKIAPRRFNPEGKAWLPILRTERGGWEFTCLYSNTPQAHKLGKTDDWVVIYYRKDDGGTESQNTVVTAASGSLRGRRVVRGREAECRKHYEKD